VAPARARTPAPTLSDVICFRLTSNCVFAAMNSRFGRVARAPSAPYIGVSWRRNHMTTEQFFEQLDTRIAKYDLLCHPFYQAWSAGELTREDLREYARDYYHHVEAFPIYLAELAMRLDDGELRRAVLANMCEEKGVGGSGSGARPHHEVWLDFAEGMGAHGAMHAYPPAQEIRNLMSHFH